MNIKKIRIDIALVERGLVSSRTRAQAMIMAGHVLVDDQPVHKAGHMVSEDSLIRLREEESKYVSRGAYKLIEALKQFKIQPQGCLCMDVGSSTGGFTQVLLEQEAKKVYCIDSGTNQLAWKIRNDVRVIVMENTNARYLSPESLFKKSPQETDELFDLIVMDVSFISIRLIIPALKNLLKAKGKIIFLYKPQFELGPEWVAKGGIVKNQDEAQRQLAATMKWCVAQGFSALGTITSPIEGSSGNVEYLGAIELT